MDAPALTRRFYKTTKAREYRLRRAVKLADAARFADLSLFRASFIERFPEKARPGELDRLRGGVDLAAAEP